MKPSLADQMSSLPELHSAQDFKHPVTEEQCHFVLENYVNSDECHNDFQEYFNYVVDIAELTPPGDWREALALYNRLIAFAGGS